jgi:hypothetical protein
MHTRRHVTLAYLTATLECLRVLYGHIGAIGRRLVHSAEQAVRELEVSLFARQARYHSALHHKK